MVRALIGRMRPPRQQNATKTARPAALRDAAMNRCPATEWAGSGETLAPWVSAYAISASVCPCFRHLSRLPVSRSNALNYAWTYVHRVKLPD
jgi:hypothetical protein